MNEFIENKTGKYFVTGASGFIGRYLCEELCSKGNEVKALVRKNTDPVLHKLGVELVVGDLLKPESYAKELNGCDYVVHLGGDPVFANGGHYHDINYLATVHLLENIRKHTKKLKRFLYVSTLGAVDRKWSDICDEPLNEASLAYPTTDYGKSKLDAEIAIQSSGIPYTIIRPALIVGKDMRFNSHVAVFCRAALNKSLISKVSFPGRMSVLHVKDLVSAIRVCLYSAESLGQVYFASGEPISIADIVMQVTGKKPLINLSFLKYLLIPILYFLPFKAKALFFDAMVASDIKLTTLGWRQRVSLTTAVDEIAKREKTRLLPYSPLDGYTLITGAASGLGAAIANKLSSHRKNIILVDRDKEGLDSILSEHENVIRIVCELSKEDELDELTSLDIWDSYGVDEVFLCAGFGTRGKFLEQTVKSQENILKVNLLSRLSLIHKSLQYMNKKHFGRVVIISSSSAFQPLPYMSVYAASNAGLISMGEAIWGEMVNTGVEILTVCPGGMQTNFQSSAGVKTIEGEKLDTPEAVAEKILNRIGSPKPTLLVNARVYIMELMSRILPRALRVKLWGKLMSGLR